MTQTQLQLRFFPHEYVTMLRDDGAFEGEPMQRRSGDPFGEIQADADLGSGNDRKGDRVTDDGRPRGDRDRGTTPETDTLNRAESDAGCVIWRRHSHRANGKG